MTKSPEELSITLAYSLRQEMLNSDMKIKYFLCGFSIVRILFDTKNSITKLLLFQEHGKLENIISNMLYIFISIWSAHAKHRGKFIWLNSV